eukprot:TRINITY_DN7930_c0_g1_i1.p1 TRINITY_DN7930_c0_g1~~TRINITY_DN7930_c0_g1_i1.p1  ORF type:complete len:346 (+),score=78.63 TRINITY_DN7930_c0_g1_i1:253-1290(+)
MIVSYPVYEEETQELNGSLLFSFEDEEMVNTNIEENGTGEICKYFLKGSCVRGERCIYRHSRGEKKVVCKHWLRGLCKKGTHCEFLHIIDPDKYPPCHFFTTYGECNNKECIFRHIIPENNKKSCPWYARGFCRHGPKCRHEHVKKEPCVKYLAGFCPDGTNCKYGHPKFELPETEMEENEMNHNMGHMNNIPPPNNMNMFGQNNMYQNKMKNNMMNMDNKMNLNGGPKMNINGPIICHHCNTLGHISTHCPLKNNNIDKKIDNVNPFQNNPNIPNNPLSKAPRPLNTVTCFKCGVKGHYANKCPNKMNPAGQQAALQAQQVREARALHKQQQTQKGIPTFSMQN